VISPTQRYTPDNTQQSKETGIHAPGGIVTHIPSKQAAADPRLRQRSYWDREELIIHIAVKKDLQNITQFIVIKKIHRTREEKI
jgi:hypothetical protein